MAFTLVCVTAANVPSRKITNCLALMKNAAKTRNCRTWNEREKWEICLEHEKYFIYEIGEFSIL